MAPGVSSCHFRDIPPSISFSGSGFLCTYQLGVSQCILNYAPWILRTSPCVLGASAGSLVAAAIVCEISMETIRDEMLSCAKRIQTLTLGPLSPSINVLHWIESVLHKHLPSDAHTRASGRLAVAMTRVTDRKLIIMSDFQSKEDVLQALLCSCFLPVYCGMLAPSFKGVHYLDGGFSSMQPLLPTHSGDVLTVSPFAGDADICPADTHCIWDLVISGSTLKGNMANSSRLINALYPMSVETLEQAYDSGYKDAINFLQSKNLGPHWLTHRALQGPLNHVYLQTSMHLKSNIEEKEPATLTSSIDNRCMQMESSTEPESTGNRQIKKPPLHLNTIKNVFLGNTMIYLSMVGLPARIFSYLLIPLILSFQAVLQSGRRLELMSRQAPELVFWAWYGLRHFTFFFLNTVVCSFKKNSENWIMPIVIVLQWLMVLAQYDDPPADASPGHKFPFAAHSEEWKRWSLHRWFVVPSQDYKAPTLQ